MGHTLLFFLSSGHFAPVSLPNMIHILAIFNVITESIKILAGTSMFTSFGAIHDMRLLTLGAFIIIFVFLVVLLSYVELILAN